MPEESGCLQFNVALLILQKYDFINFTCRCIKNAKVRLYLM